MWGPPIKSKLDTGEKGGESEGTSIGDPLPYILKKFAIITALSNATAFSSSDPCKFILLICQR